MRRKKSNFSSTFWEEALLLDGFLRDIDSGNIVLLKKKPDLHTPPFMVISERHDRRTEKQLKQWGTSRILAYPFSDKLNYSFIHASWHTMYGKEVSRTIPERLSKNWIRRSSVPAMVISNVGWQAMQLIRELDGEPASIEKVGRESTQTHIT